MIHEFWESESGTLLGTHSRLPSSQVYFPPNSRVVLLHLGSYTTWGLTIPHFTALPVPKSDRPLPSDLGEGLSSGLYQGILLWWQGSFR